MDIIKFYYNKTRDIILQVSLTAKNFDYMNWLVLESLESVYLLSVHQKETVNYLKNITNTYNVTSLNRSTNSTLSLFVEEAIQKFKFFSDNHSDSQNILENICTHLKIICECTKVNNNDTNYWEKPKYHDNIPDSKSAKELLISMYLFCILLFLYCAQSNDKLFSVLTETSINMDENINILNDFYQKGITQTIQFFLPIEADVTLSYFLYRYVFDESVSGKLSSEWAMGNTSDKSVPSKIKNIIDIMESWGKGNSEKTIKNETYHSWVDALNKYGIFDTNKVDSIEKIKVLCLRQYILTAKWNDTDRPKRNLNLINFIKRPESSFFREFGTHIITESNIAGTILVSELMKELPIKDVCFWGEKCLGVELGIKNIQNILKILCTSNCYIAPHREAFIYELEYCHKNYKKEMDNKTTNTFSEYNPILAAFLIYNLYKAKACLQNAYTQFIFLNEHFDDLILSVYPKWDDNPQEQEEVVMFDDLTGEKLSKILSNIDIKFSSSMVARKELNRLCTFFRLYFPEKYLVDQKCTQRELVSVYELLNDVKQSSLEEKIIKAFSATREAHDEAGIVRELALAKIEMHHMASNYSTIFIPTVLRVLNLFEYPDNAETNNMDKMSFYSNAIYELCNCSKHINIWAEQLCRYLFGRNIDGKYCSDFIPNRGSIDVHPDAKDIFNDFFIPWENSIIENICANRGISREELSNIWYGNQK